ncbi:hypothetical protein [Paraburkholderia youngii]|uniref:hypothetical protein n=1 Tax=Paraburkholderia youngii TaxID=2782701 RepID=UPI00159488AA|nr:hypothetical protein [Paraburkholderia youngii]
MPTVTATCEFVDLVVVEAQRAGGVAGRAEIAAGAERVQRRNKAGIFSKNGDGANNEGAKLTGFGCAPGEGMAESAEIRANPW